MPFFRRKTPDWSALSWVFDQNHNCPCCGTSGPALLSLACDGPDVFPRDAAKLENAALLQMEGDILTEDFCRLDRYRFVRCVIEFPLQGRDEFFVLGVWATLSQENFDTYVSLFDAGRTGDMDKAFSWLSNAIPPKGKLPREAVMVFQPDRQRPKLYAPDGEDPLDRWQDKGLTPDDLRYLLERYGHSLKGRI